MFKKNALIAGLGLVMSATSQADYRWQIDAAAARTNVEVGRHDGDIDNYGIGGTFYFSDVDTSKGPLGEAVFLDHSSYVSASYIYTDLDDIVEDADGDAYGLNGRYVLPLDSFPLIFEGSWTRETPDFSDIDYYSLGFGAYVTDATTIVLTYRTSDIDDTSEIDAGDIDGYEISVEHSWHLSSGAISLEGMYGLIDVDETEINDGDDIDTWHIGGTWYVNNDLGFGLSYGQADSFGSEEDTFGVSAEWFVTEGIGLSLRYEESEIDDTDLESDTVLLGVEIRL